MERVKWNNRWTKYILSEKLQRSDIIIVFLMIFLLCFCWIFRMPLSEALSSKVTITGGYEAQQGRDGRFYVLDSGHERLLCFDKKGVLCFVVENLADEKGKLSYIDDFYVTDEGIYVSASQWDEMAISREAVISLDKRGNYIKTFTARDYEKSRVNKHRFYGITEVRGEPVAAECLSQEICIGEKRIPFQNASEWVYDVVFFEDHVYILDKTGTVWQYSVDAEEGKIIYEAEKEGESIVPYRMSVDQNGDLYYTDIRGSTIRRIDEKRKSTVVCESGGSLSVDITQDGACIFVCDDGMHVLEHGDERVYDVLQKNAVMLVFQAIWLIALFVGILCFLLSIVRGIRYMCTRSYSRIQMIAFSSIGVAVVVSCFLTGILMQAFTEKYRAKLEEQVECAAYMVANQISGDDINKVEEDGGFRGEAYRRLYQTMKKAFPMNIPFYRQIYCNILKIPEDGSEGYAVAYLDQSVGSYFPLDEVEQKELQMVKETGKAVWNQHVEDISGTYLSVKVPVYDETGRICGAVAAGAETYVIADALWDLVKDILLSVLILLMLVWLVSVEIMSWIYQFNICRQERKDGKQSFSGHTLRITVFLVFTAYNMSATFLPVYLLRRTSVFPEKYQNLAGALPITINLFLIGVMSLFCAGFIRRFSSQWLVILAALCSLTGNLIIYFSSGYLEVCLGLIFDGIGVGLITNGMYVLISCIREESHRIRGLSIYNSACFSGINFGTLSGSLLAVFAGQRRVFLLVALLWLMLTLMTGRLVRHFAGSIGDAFQKTKSLRSPVSGGKFITSRRVLGFMVFIQNPYIIFGSFVFYYVPLFCDEMGYGETVCSLLIMIYSQVAVIFADPLTRIFARKGKKYGMYDALVMNIAALAVYAMLPNMYSMIAALVLLGLSAAFGKPVQQKYFLNLKETRQYGEDKAIGIYNFSENIGESAGPVIFGRMLSFVGFQTAMGVFCAAAAGLGIIHCFLCRKGLDDETSK